MNHDCERNVFRNVLNQFSEALSGLNHVTVLTLNNCDVTRAIFLQRKRSSSFRDLLLLPIFRLSLNLLRDADQNLTSLDLNNPEQHGLFSQSLQLVYSCLSYDFIGTSGSVNSTVCDVSSNGMDDLVVVQIPTSWRQIFLDSETVPLFFRLYKNLSPDLSVLASTDESNQNSLHYLLTLWQRLVASIPYFGTIGRCVYGKTCNTIILLFDEYASSLEKAFNILTSNNLSVNDSHLEQVLRLEEHRLAWLVYMVGALIGGRVNYANADECDGELVCRVIQLTRLITNFITSNTSSTVSNCTNTLLTTQSPSMIRLELAVLSFFEQLRRVYVGENVGRLSKFYQCLSDKLGISDEMMILDVFINKILTNLKYWSNCESVLQRTLNLLSELSVGFSAMRKLLRLDNIQFMLINHTFGTIGRCVYGKTCNTIILLFDEYASSLEKAFNILTSNNLSVNDSHLEQVLRLEEHRLAWLVYMVGALIGGRVNYANADECDGELVCRVIQLTRLITNFITSNTSSTVSNCTNTLLTTQSPSMIRLELAVLSFFEQLRRVYVGENVGRLSKFYQCLSDKLGISDEMMILDVFINKILTNLKYWSNCESVLQRTLNLLSELSVGFSAMRKLLRLDNIQFMLINHTSISDCIIGFLIRYFDYDFMNSSNFNEKLMKISIIGLARDIRGILYSLNNKASYQMLMNWIYPNGLLLFNRVLELWPYDYTITIPILKTITELINNRNGRLLYDITIPTGYLLFTYVSKLLCNFGLQLLSNPCQIPKNSLYQIKLKPIMTSLNLLKICLSGNLVNFGVFSMFHDDSLERVMEMSIQLLLSLSNTELHDHPKLALCHFGLLEHMLNEHIIFVASLGTPILLHFLETIANNIISLDSGISEVCCVCLDYFSTHLFKIVQREQRSNRTTDAKSNLLNLLMPTTSNSQNVEMISGVNLLRRILITLLSSVIQEECRCQWSMSRPLLPLILLNQQVCNRLLNNLILDLFSSIY
uniref:Exportin-7 n=1 Tax=Schistosoma haematobium TaxID=6185 RepID=A0A095A144_SCHHA